jgi:hypothetical protein
MSFGVYKVVIEQMDQSHRREVYEYGESDFDAIQVAVEKHSYPGEKIRVSAKKLGNAIDLLESVRSKYAIR